MSGGDDKCLQNLARKPGRKSSLGTSGGKWEDNFELDLREILSEGVDWIQLAQNGVQCRFLLN
jgi:hypothetical protein